MAPILIFFLNALVKTCCIKLDKSRTIIHMYMEVPQGNSMCSYFKQTKRSFFFFFSYTKSETRKIKHILYGGLVPFWRGRGGEKVGKVNMVQILHIHVCKWKIMSVETISGMREEGIKENDGRADFKHNPFDIFKNFCKCHNTSPTQQ
jgi:hypothetical protein